MVFQWRLIDSKSPQVSRTFIIILADHSNGVIWMVPSRPLISMSFCHLVSLPSAPITIGTTVTFMFHSFLVLRQGLVIYLSFRFSWVLSSGQPEGLGPLFSRFSFLCWLSLDLVIWLILDDLFVSKIPTFYNYYFYYLRVFHTSLSWWFSSGVRVKASLLKSPGHFSVFWPISIML